MDTMSQAKPAMTPVAFRKLIAAAGLNQTSAADKLGVDRRTVVRWLSGATPISKRNALLIRAVITAK